MLCVRSTVVMLAMVYGLVVSVAAGAESFTVKPLGPTVGAPVQTSAPGESFPSWVEKLKSQVDAENTI